MVVITQKMNFKERNKGLNVKRVWEILRRVINEVSIGVRKSQYVFFFTQWASLQCVFLQICSKYRSGLYMCGYRILPDRYAESEAGGGIKEIGIDEMWHYISKKLKNCGTQGIWPEFGANYRMGYGESWYCNGARLYSKLKHLKECFFYTDDWKAFLKVLPTKRLFHRKETHAIYWVR